MNAKQEESPKPAKPSSPVDAPRRRRLFPRTLAECVDPLTKPVFSRHGMIEARIIRDWQNIVGPELARHSMPKKLAFPRGRTEEGMLTILVQSGFALPLQYQTPLILERLAVYFGYRAIARIMVQQTHALPGVEEKKPASTYAHQPTEEGGDPLDAALKRLGAALKQRD